MNNNFLSEVIAAQVIETGNSNYIHTHDRVWIERQDNRIRVKAEAICLNEYGSAWGCGLEGEVFLPLEDAERLPFMDTWYDIEPTLGVAAPAEICATDAPTRLKSGKKT